MLHQLHEPCSYFVSTVLTSGASVRGLAEADEKTLGATSANKASRDGVGAARPADCLHHRPGQDCIRHRPGHWQQRAGVRRLCRRVGGRRRRSAAYSLRVLRSCARQILVSRSPNARLRHVVTACRPTSQSGTFLGVHMFIG